MIYKNILFVGDAGVGTFPISGQGIYRALLSGNMAGKCLAERKSNKYSIMMNKYFVKWDFILKNFLRINITLRKINPNLFLTSLNYLNYI